jgi:hypothetical protein
VDVVQIAPESLFSSAKDRGPLLKLISAGNQDCQIQAYRLLSNNIRESVKELVVEVALGSQGEMESEIAIEESPIKKVKIEEEIVVLLQNSNHLDESHDYAFLLAWLALFDHFEESSLQLKSIYTSQIQALGLLENSLLPFFFTQTNLQYDPSQWVLDEVYLDGESG